MRVAPGGGSSVRPLIRKLGLLRLPQRQRPVADLPVPGVLKLVVPEADEPICAPKGVGSFP